MDREGRAAGNAGENVKKDQATTSDSTGTSNANVEPLSSVHALMERDFFEAAYQPETQDSALHQEDYSSDDPLLEFSRNPLSFQWPASHDKRPDEIRKINQSRSESLAPSQAHDKKGSDLTGAILKKRRGNDEKFSGRCHSCNRTETPEWRRGPDGARTLCNQCGLHYAKLTRRQVSSNATSMNSKQIPKSYHDSTETIGDKLPSQKAQPESWILSRIDHSTEDPNIGLIETLYRCCSAAFLSLWKLKLRFITPFRQKNILKMDVASLELWKESFTPGQLDAALQETSPLRLSVVENLKAFGSFLLYYLRLQDGTVSLSRHDQNIIEDFTRELEAHLEKTAILMSIEEGSEWSSEEQSDEPSSSFERRRNNLGRLHSYIRCLMDLAPAIENHIDRLANKYEELPLPSKSVLNRGHYAQPFAMHIHDRFQDTRLYMVERLAKANWDRFVRIRARPPSIKDVIPSADSNPDTALQIPVSKPCTPDTFGIDTPSSRFSISAFGEDDQGQPRVPPPPNKIGTSFKCGYCQLTNLQSYICTQSDCDESLEAFSTQELWADHEFNKHFTITHWHCFRFTLSTPTRLLLVRHLEQHHGEAAHGKLFEIMVTDSRKTVLKPGFKNQPCALCSQTGWETKEDYISHVGKHLEEISLLCLPLGGESRESNHQFSDPTPASVCNKEPQIYCANCKRPWALNECFACTECICAVCRKCVAMFMKGKPTSSQS